MNTAMKRSFTRRDPVKNTSTNPRASQQQPSQRTGAVKQPTNSTANATTSRSSTSNLVPPPQQYQQQQRWTPPQQQSGGGLPAQSVWGKQRPAPPEPQPLPNPSPQPSNHEAKPVNVVKNNNNNNNSNNNHSSQPTGSNNKKESVRILQKKKPEAAVLPTLIPNSSISKESQARKVPGRDQPKGSIPTTNKAKAQPKPSKPTKNKPQLQSMSLGDLIVMKPTNPPINKAKGGKQQQQQQQQQSKSQTNHKKKAPPILVSMDLSKDFPSLSHATGPTNPSSQSSLSSSSLLTKSTWGKSTVVSTTNNKNQQPQPPTTNSTSLLSSQGPLVTSAKDKETLSNNARPKNKNNNNKNNNNNNNNKTMASMFFQPKTDILRDGDEHKLSRLLQERNVYEKKGRQRIKVPKKKFSVLKKKVLQERLQKWRALNASPDDTKDAIGTQPSDSYNCMSSSSLCIYNYVHAEEVEDEDEYQEILENLQEFASKVGSVPEIFIPRMDRAENYPVFVRFESSKDASAALACWEGLVVGGDHLHVKLIPDAPSEPELSDWKEWVLLSESTSTTEETPSEIASDEVVTISLSGILTDDDYDDEDCMMESLEDLRAVATKCGTLVNLLASDERDGAVMITYQAKVELGGSIVKRLQEWTIGGKQLSPSIVPPTCVVSDKDTSTLLLDNILTEDDLEDEDCLAETLSDIRELVGHHGNVLNVEVVDNAVQVTYQGNALIAQTAATALNGMKLSGLSINARVMAPPTQGEEGQCVFLYNILTEEDLEDEDCLQESLNDIRTLASKHGRVKDLEVIQDEEGKRGVKITYDTANDDDDKHTVEAALAELNGLVVGGLIVKATSSWAPTPLKQEIGQEVGDAESDTTKRKQDSEDESNTKKAKTEDAVAVKPLFSGDKLIPERFAEAKRIPKIPNAPGPREYAKSMNDESVKPLLTEMLGELMRLQKRAVEDNNTKAKRRLVMGLREVARGIRSHKVKMVIMANNLDEYGAIDTKLQEIIDLAHTEEVPLFFEFTKKNLGKALGKSIKIAVVGVQNADGANQLFKKLAALASTKT